MASTHCLLCSIGYPAAFGGSALMNNPDEPEEEGWGCATQYFGDNVLMAGYGSKHDNDAFVVCDDEQQLLSHIMKNKERFICDDCLELEMSQGRVKFLRIDNCNGIGSYPLSYYHPDCLAGIKTKCDYCSGPNYHALELDEAHPRWISICHSCRGKPLL